MDKREMILARLLVVLTGVAGITTVRRNKREFSEELCPAIGLYDGDEEAEEADGGRGRPAASPNRVTMTPEILIKLGSVPEDVGTALNAFRVLVIKAILNDAELASIVGSDTGNGEIRYRGCATSLSTGRQIEGEMGMFFSLQYNLIPAKL